MAELRVPEVSHEIIDWLLVIHPPKVVGVAETIEEAQRYAGFQDCIELLRLHNLRQTDPAIAEEDREALEDVYEVPDGGGFVKLGPGRLQPRRG